MDESFYQALLRISIAQVLKAAGFDKCKPSVLNIITDIYIRQFEQLLSVAKNFALERTAYTNDLSGSDILEALLSVGLLKPRESDSGPDSNTNTKSLESFVNWTKYSDIFNTSKKLNTIPVPLLYNLMEKRKIDTSAETDQERKKRRLRERQEFYNQLKQNDDTNTDNADGLMEDLDDDELQNKDKLSWLAYLAEKDVKLGQNMKFLNSCIQDDLMAVHKNKKYHPTVADGEDSYAYFKSQVEKSIKNDYIIISSYEADDKDGAKDSVVVPPAELKNALPYNIQYSEVLLDDDLSQFMVYANKHEDEISQRLADIEESKSVSERELDDVGESEGKELEEVAVPDSQKSQEEAGTEEAGTEAGTEEAGTEEAETEEAKSSEQDSNRHEQSMNLSEDNADADFSAEKKHAEEVSESDEDENSKTEQMEGGSHEDNKEHQEKSDNEDNHDINESTVKGNGDESGQEERNGDAEEQEQAEADSKPTKDNASEISS